MHAHSQSAILEFVSDSLPNHGTFGDHTHVHNNRSDHIAEHDSWQRSNGAGRGWRSEGVSDDAEWGKDEVILHRLAFMLVKRMAALAQRVSVFAKANND